MTTEQFYADVAGHLLKNYKPGDLATAVFEQYAKEELNWEEARAKKFAEEVEQGRKVEGMNINGEQRFYTWYYLNYMKTITSATGEGKPSAQQHES
jgi:hypothetical protein